MTYLEWNNAMGEFFFNEKKTKQEVHLYITKADVVSIGKKFIHDKTDDEVWSDFIKSLKMGVPGTPQNTDLVQKALFAYTKINYLNIANTPLLFPPHLTYLTLFILPFTEYQGDFDPRDYYNPLIKYLVDNKLSSKPDSKGFVREATEKWEEMWRYIERWSNEIKQGSLGQFKVRFVGNQKWKYVGIPLSQCLMSSKVIHSLPRIFHDDHLSPYQNLPSETFRLLLLEYADSLGLNLNVRKLLNDAENPLCISIIEMVKNNYKNWTGEKEVFNEGSEIRIKKDWTLCRLRLCLKLYKENEKVDMYYRLFTLKEYPDDLVFHPSINCDYEGNGFSKPINIGYEENIELKNSENKWKAIFKEKPIRLFQTGSCEGLNDWIEVDDLQKHSPTYILCASTLQNEMDSWGKTFDQGNFKKLDYDGMPKNFLLYYFKSPKTSHPKIESLSLPSEISIQLIKGLEVSNRKYLKNLLPKVKITNIREDDVVYIETSDGTYFNLDRHPSTPGVWVLPKEIPCNRDFVVKIKDQTSEDSKNKYRILDQESIRISDIEEVPKRGKLGEISLTEALWVKGIEIDGDFDALRKLRMRTEALYSNIFTPLSQ